MEFRESGRPAIDCRGAGISAIACRDAGYSPEELLELCHTPYDKTQAYNWAGYEGHPVICEGKFGKLTFVHPRCPEDIRVEYDDGTRNSVNTHANCLATDGYGIPSIQYGSARLLFWMGEPPSTPCAVVKTIIFLRHGESEFNAHMAKFGEDPLIRDAPLTPKGREQASAAREHLQHILLSLGADRALRVVSSPLRRAVETALLARPEARAHIDLWPEVREVICGCDDIGTPASELCQIPLFVQACGQLAPCFATLPEVWWTVPSELVGSLPPGLGMVEAYREHSARFEDADEQGLEERIRATVRRLASVEESVVLLVAHCDFVGQFTTYLGLESSRKAGWWLRNAELRVAEEVRLCY